MIRQVLSQDNLYSNCKMLSPEGLEMCRCSEKRAKWYLKKGLARVVSQDPYLTIRLTFQPEKLGHYGDPYYLADKDNICVVCGAKDRLTNHHCVPYRYRRYFPAKYKSHTSHDILLMCTECHNTYEELAAQKHEEVISQYFPDFNNQMSKIQRARTKLMSDQSLCITWRDKRDEIPEYAHAEIESKIARAVGETDFDPSMIDIILNKELEHSVDDLWEQLSRGIGDIQAFCEDWRRHFLETTKPKYMPKYWRIDYRPRDD